MLSKNTSKYKTKRPPPIITNTKPKKKKRYKPISPKKPYKGKVTRKRWSEGEKRLMLVNEYKLHQETSPNPFSSNASYPYQYEQKEQEKGKEMLVSEQIVMHKWNQKDEEEYRSLFCDEILSEDDEVRTSTPTLISPAQIWNIWNRDHPSFSVHTDIQKVYN
jgi:hypothetical protein